jgi:murein DD-endopeptidase MepM/ murein hydrolase activator NlpD
LTFIATAFLFTFSVIAAIVPAINIPSHEGGDEPLFPAPPGYLLPWVGGEIESVTQGEETSFTHNGLAAYAYDFGLNYDTVVAARSGRVTLVYDGSNRGGCSAFYSTFTNYVVIDHGDGTSGVYMHLAHGSATVLPGQEVAQGEPIAISGETGVTCSDIDGGPGPHLHFQVQRTVEGAYFSQSLPIAFDDVPDNDGVPRPGASYVSGNFGPGKPQKIALTPRRVQREFNPQAVPLYPSLVEAEPVFAPTPGINTTSDTPTPEGTPTATPLIPDSTEVPTEIPTDTPEPSATPEPFTPEPSSTNTHTPTPPPPPATPTPEPPSPVPSDTAEPEFAPSATPADTETPVP